MQLPEHGANPHRLYEKMGIPMPAILYDFSENVNPFGLPKKISEVWQSLLKEVSAYPDPHGEPFLSAASEFHNISKDHLLIGNGAAEILALLAERYRGRTALVVHPTFSEYEGTLTAKQVKIHRLIAKESAGFQLPVEAIQEAMHVADVLYLCTPNNPTGVLPSKATLTALLEHGKATQCDVVLDEAFIDFVDEDLSFMSKIKAYNHLIVVRSMTKMYAIPGIRLGYVAANKEVIQEIKQFAPHWNVNGIAAAIGALCFHEQEFVEKTKLHSEHERRELTNFLTAHQCIVTESVANFITFKLSDTFKTKQLYEDLLKKGIVLRHTENFRGMNGNWLRVGMKTTEQMSRLREELGQWFAEN